MQELKNQKIWLCWIRRKTRDGKWTKVPISASGGETGTDEAHRDTWVTYEEAIKAARENRYSGVGLLFPKATSFWIWIMLIWTIRSSGNFWNALKIPIRRFL